MEKCIEDHVYIKHDVHSSAFAVSVVIGDLLPARNIGACGSHNSGAGYCLTRSLSPTGCLLREEKLVTNQEPRLCVVKQPHLLPL